MIKDCQCHHVQPEGAKELLVPGIRQPNPRCPVHGREDAIQVREAAQVHVRKAPEDSEAVGEEVRDEAAAKEEAFPIDERTHSG